jgi:hypothetical protein
MKAIDIFGIIVRATGLYLVVYGGWNLEAAFRYLFDSGDTAAYFIYGVPTFLGGILLMVLGRFIVRICYFGNKNDSED